MENIYLNLINWLIFEKKLQTHDFMTVNRFLILYPKYIKTFYIINLKDSGKIDKIYIT